MKFGVEVPLYYRYMGYDRLLLEMGRGKPAIIDFKTTRKPKKRGIDDYFLQDCPCWAIMNYGTDIKTIVIMMIWMPKQTIGQLSRICCRKR